MPEVSVLEEVIKIISTVGFPITVTGFLLWRDMKRDDKQVKATEQQNILLNELKTLIETLTK